MGSSMANGSDATKGTTAKWDESSLKKPNVEFNVGPKFNVGLNGVLPSVPLKQGEIGSVTITLNAGKYNITKDTSGFDVIEMKGFDQLILPGNPMLPHKNNDVLLPLNIDDASVTMKVVKANTRVLDGFYDIMPSYPALPQDKTTPTVSNRKNEILSNRNTNIYEANANYPENFVVLMPTSQMRKWKFVPVDFRPFQYNPVSKRLTLMDSVTIEISYNLVNLSTETTGKLLADTAMDDLAPQKFVNYNQASSFYAKPAVSTPAPGVTYDYVIITSNAIKACSTKLNSFVAQKQSQGHSVKVVTETDFGGLTGQTPNHNAEKIRQWLINNYASMGIKYVLLVGNPSTYESGAEGDIPMKLCWPRLGAGDGVEDSPTDYFYADLTGNWDYNGNGYFGDPDDFVTGGVDFANEVIVGRIPVYNTDCTSLDSILQKIMDYENSADTAWRKSAILPMGFSDSSTDGAYLAEEMKNNYLTSNGYSTWRMYQKGSGPCADNSVFSADQELRGGTTTSTFRDRWAANDYGIVCWWAHGNTNIAGVGYGGCEDGLLMYSPWCSNLDDSHPSFAYLCSCLCGSPEQSDNLQYSILKQGGVSTVSATRDSWYYIGQTEFQNSASNSGIGYDYVNRLVQNKPGGDALFQTKTRFNPANGAEYMNYFDFNLYGDPSTGLSSTSPPPAWTKLGGYVTSSPSAVVDNLGHTEVWVKGSTNQLHVNIDGTWKNAPVISGGVTATSDPFAVKDTNGKIHVLVRGSNGHAMDLIYVPSTNYAKWKDLSGSIAGGLTGAKDPYNSYILRVAVRGTSNALYTGDLNVNTESFGGWVSQGGSLTSRPYIMFDPSGMEHILVRGSAGNLYDKKGVWGGSSYTRTWNSLGGSLASGSNPVATIEPGFTSFFGAFVRAATNAAYFGDVYTGSPETLGWHSMGGSLTSDTFAVADSTAQRIHVFVRGTDSKLYEKVIPYAYTTGGVSWHALGGSLLPYTSGAVIGSDTKVYVVGNDHALYRKTYASYTDALSGKEGSSEKEKIDRQTKR